MAATARTFFTIGHSTRSIDEFAGLLREVGVALVADVRTVPRSRTNPQFNADALPDSLAPYQIGYRHFPKLGGLRGRRRGAVGSSPNMLWRNESFRNYADYAATEPFREGLNELRAEGHERTVAIMCAEAVWWRCHRRIIADYLLLAAGGTVFHILGPGKIEPATPTPGVQSVGDGMLLAYRAPVVLPDPSAG
jgi:uncharacterized protein (DUF488 family)